MRGRPRKCRLIGSKPGFTSFKPRGIPGRELEEMMIGLDELEALGLADRDGLDHEASGVLMGVSRQTFGRIVESARRKVATALLEGRALVFEEGHVAMRSSQARRFECGRCMRSFMEPHGTGRPAACPHCGSSSFERAASERGHAGPCTGRGRARGVE